MNESLPRGRRGVLWPLVVVLLALPACVPNPVPPLAAPAPSGSAPAGKEQTTPVPVATFSATVPASASMPTPTVPSVAATPSPSPMGTPGSMTATRTPPTVTSAPGTPPPLPSAAQQPIVATPAPNDLLFPISRDLALPPSYVPPDLVPIEGIVPTVRGPHLIRRVVVEDLRRLVRDMQAAGLNPVVASAYRSYAMQEATYAYWVRTLGQVQADRVSAKPGHSEHQLGTAIDFASAENGYELDERFAATREGRWLLAHADRYGFVLSYPAGAEAITGYAYEPWHYRYVGPADARAIAASGRPPIEYYRARWR
ncbi:MAG: D-alanyl-D-alanine carboxypeptidase family protein [Chloroflexota bacterium]|nr:D-alanyl-D-alanine carboxypeptidase family protein [Chloroflexota bacterium]